MTLPDRDRRVVWHPYTQHGLAEPLLPVASAEGSWLTLTDGTRMLDAISSWWCCLHGHAHPVLTAALAQQARTLDHVLFAGCTHEPAVALAERLVALAPPGLGRVFYSDNGSTAVEVALKAAVQRFAQEGQSQRRVFLALDGGYHGDTFGAMSVGDPDPFFDAYGPLLFEVARTPLDAEALEAAAHRLGDRLAGIVMEPGVQGAAGMRIVPPSLLRAARAAADATGAWLIADEVMVGFGRTGRTFACEHAGVTPDALCLSKGLTSGMLPLAATLFPERHFEAFASDDRSRMFFHGHTYTGNPLACAVACASLDLLEADDTPRKLARGGARLEATLRGGLGGADEARRLDLRQLGGIVAVTVPDTEGGYLSDVGPRLREAARVASPDVLLRPLGNVLYALPPASTDEAGWDLIAERMLAVLAEVLS